VHIRTMSKHKLIRFITARTWGKLSPFPYIILYVWQQGLHPLLLTFSLCKDFVDTRVLELVLWRPQNIWFRYSKKVAYEGREWKFIIIQGVNICETVWYQIIGLLRSTYMLCKSNNKWGCQFLSHHNKGTHKLQISTK